ncbi:glutathione S-transferase [Roridomyces roridus]|uniref:glutathione transferase n=1 Tax=Roridomyces roridus TaxID=1738132 RepID=A0AAD7FBJ9_9AGAR|nr:glutathione S-transferase [Roridomyces roridus]
MVLKLVGAPVSTCTRRVATVLVEKKVPFEFIPIDMSKGEHKAASFVSNQPFGQVPYIDDDGFILYESRAIGRYLCDKYPDQGAKLVPALNDVKGRALFEQAASNEYQNFDPLAYRACFEMIFKKRRGLTPDPAVFEQLITALAAKLEAYEIILGKQKYLAGDEITLADLFHIPYATTLALAGTDIMSKQGPNVTRWYKELSERPSWVAVKDGVQSMSSY